MFRRKFMVSNNETLMGGRFRIIMIPMDDPDTPEDERLIGDEQLGFIEICTLSKTVADALAIGQIRAVEVHEPDPAV